MDTEQQHQGMSFYGAHQTSGVARPSSSQANDPGYHNTVPHPSFGQWLNHGVSQQQHAPSDDGSLGWSHIPYQYTLQQQQPRTAQMGPVVTHAPWPSTLANPQVYNTAYYSSGSQPDSGSSRAAAPASASMVASSNIQPAPVASPDASSAAMTKLKSQSSSLSQPAPTPRRTLTDTDRRRMCEYHAQHPGKKQTEIGEVFGVERSTVSKVLRQKEKYLSQEEPAQSPTRKPKPRYPDVERTLATWFKKRQEAGTYTEDQDILEQARQFCLAGGSNPDISPAIGTPAWLAQFKLKYALQASEPRGSVNAGSKKRSPALRENDGDEVLVAKRGRTPSTHSVSQSHSQYASETDTSPQLPSAAVLQDQRVRSHESLQAAALAEHSPMLSPEFAGGVSVAGSQGQRYYGSIARPPMYASQQPMEPYMSPPPGSAEVDMPSQSIGQVVSASLAMPPPGVNYSRRATAPDLSSHMSDTQHSPADSLPTPTSPRQRLPSLDDAHRGLETTMHFLTHSHDHAYVNTDEFEVLKNVLSRFRMTPATVSAPPSSTIATPSTAPPWSLTPSSVDHSHPHGHSHHSLVHGSHNLGHHQGMVGAGQHTDLQDPRNQLKLSWPPTQEPSYD